MSAPAGLCEGPPSTISDRVFENELNIAVFRSREAYDKLLFREALKCAGYDLTNARDVYRWALLCHPSDSCCHRHAQQMTRSVFSCQVIAMRRSTGCLMCIVQSACATACCVFAALLLWWLHHVSGPLAHTVPHLVKVSATTLHAASLCACNANQQVCVRP
jgi:hypothetical protein